MRQFRSPFGIYRQLLPALLCLTVLLFSLACSAGDSTLTVYSGRSQTLVHPLLEQFIDESGLDVQVKYASSPAIAGTLLEEGKNSPADVVFLQDPGSLGNLAEAGLLAELPSDILDKVDLGYKSQTGQWVGTSGRARTVVYNTSAVNPQTELPRSILDFTDTRWANRIGWAPTNGSFQAFLTAFRLEWGEEAARNWLEGIQANSPRLYPNNVSIVDAVARGEVDVGLVNHYYAEQFIQEEGLEFGARNHFIGGGDPGALVLVAGAGIVSYTDNRGAAEQLVRYLLSDTAQRYFAQNTREYPLVDGVQPGGELPPLDSLDPPEVDLGALTDARGTVSLLRETGILP
ncbi:MAG: iron ABC transporter substrate-binding protein [Chloroflexi bacterium]|nr:iron ABC transporter substrate-binding protein [Chloroflexota bacterium]